MQDNKNYSFNYPEEKPSYSSHVVCQHTIMNFKENQVQNNK